MQSLPDARCLQAVVEVAHCDYNQREVWDFHILQTESRRLDLSAVFMGLPGSKIDTAAALLRFSLRAWNPFSILLQYSYSRLWDGALQSGSTCVRRLSASSSSFLHLSVRKSLVIKFLSSRYMRPVHLSVTVMVHGSMEPSNTSKFYNTISVRKNVTRNPTIITLL